MLFLSPSDCYWTSTVLDLLFFCVQQSYQDSYDSSSCHFDNQSMTGSVVEVYQGQVQLAGDHMTAMRQLSTSLNNIVVSVPLTRPVFTSKFINLAMGNVKMYVIVWSIFYCPLCHFSI